ncbi:MAG TPA: hypothetical protein VGR81_00825 [Candidatus Acidoferrales bacterium]|nr:hypothetical protein [Candidatus Acidoferrales bacterium]
MPDSRCDWHEETTRLLSDTRFSAAEREEISRELGDHLEDLYESSRRDGFDDSAAGDRALAELHEDARLGLHLRRARKENPMNLNDDTKRFWLPGMAMLFASAALLGMFQIAGLRPHLTTISIYGGPTDARAVYWPLIFYYPWLCILPFLGAAGGYWSRRVGGSSAVQAAGRFFSTFVFLAVFMIVLQFANVLGGMNGGVPLGKTLIPDGAGVILSWVVIPGLALLVGVLPFLRGNAQREAA